MAKTCNYNFNGERKTGKTKEECAKLAARFKKHKEQLQREFDSISGRSRDNKKETPKPNKKKKKLGKIVTGIKKGIKRGIERRKKKKASKRSYNPYD
jgi:hypothetical protein